MSPDRLRLFTRFVLRRTVLDPVRDGRIRDVGWPRGLAAVVGALLVAYLAGVALVLAARPVRAVAADLAVVPTYGLGIPRPVLGALVALVVVAVAAFLTASLHGPWWLRTLATLAVLVVLGLWGLQPGLGLAAAGLLVVVLVAMVGVVVLVVLTARRPFAWWQFSAALGLLGLGFAAALLRMARGAATLGFELTPTLLDQLLQLLAVIATPAALAAGVSVAEVTLRATLAVTGGVRRVANGRVLHLVLVVVVLIRLGQLGWLGWRVDPVVVGWPGLITTAVVAVVLLAVAALVLRGRPTPAVTELPERMSRYGLPVGVGLVALLVPLLVVLLGLQLAVALDPAGPVGRITAQPAELITSPGATAVSRLLLAVAVAVVAVRAARAGRTAAALLLGGVVVMLVALTPRFLTGNRWATTVDPDVLNALASVGVLGLVVVLLARRRLTPDASLRCATALVVSALFSARDFVSDPLGTVIGVSGVALVLFGVSWDLLTGSEWANGSSRRFPTPTRVLLVLANALLVVAILAFTALVRDPEPGFSLDAYASLGDFVLGTALLAAAYAVVLRRA